MVHVPDPKQRARAQAREIFRRSILEAAEKVFIANGFLGTRMADIAAEAGLATGTLYNYFDSKEAIFSEMFTQAGDEFFAELDSARAALDSPVQRSRAHLVHTVRFIRERQSLYGVFCDLGDPRKLPDELRERQEAFHNRYLETLASELAEAIEAGELRDDVEPTKLAFTLASALEGVLQGVMWSGQDEDIEPCTNLLIEILLRGAAR